MTRINFVFCILAWSALAQHKAESDGQRPAVLLSRMSRHSIATKNPEAQRFFDKGLVLLYGFNREEAVRSFRRAGELDPKSPTPPPSLLLDFRVVGIHPAGVLHRLDQVFNFHHIRVVFHNRFFVFQRDGDFFHTLYFFQFR